MYVGDPYQTGTSTLRGSYYGTSGMVVTYYVTGIDYADRQARDRTYRTERLAHEMWEHERYSERRFRASLARMKAIAAFPAFLDIAAEPHDPAMHAEEPEPRVPTARRSGCRSRGRRPLRARPGRRRKLQT